jgi:hypothetical protein
MLCPITGGAYKRLQPQLPGNAPPRNHLGESVRSSGWCHALCAAWNTHTRFGDVSRMEPVLNWQAAISSRDCAQLCCVCKFADAGFCTPCAYPGCKEAWHPMCGRHAGLRMEQTMLGSLRGFCDSHRAVTDEELAGAAEAAAAVAAAAAAQQARLSGAPAQETPASLPQPDAPADLSHPVAAATGAAGLGLGLGLSLASPPVQREGEVMGFELSNAGRLIRQNSGLSDLMPDDAEY